jgi:hypothetical protein
MDTMHTATPFASGKLAILRKASLFLACFFLLAFTALAQTKVVDEWTEDDDEEPTEEKALLDDRPAKVEDVTIRLNDELFTWKDELTIHRNDTLSISVRDLAPSSRVEIIAEKGGISLGRKVYFSNNRGELDLEVRNGSKKMKGNILMNYTPSGALKKERSIHLIID